MNIPFIVPFEPDVEILPVTPNDPVIKAEPVKGKAGEEGAYDALKAVNAYEAVKADVAYEAVPNKDPVIPADTLSDPVMFESPSEKNPFFILNSFAISFPYPRLC